MKADWNAVCSNIAAILNKIKALIGLTCWLESVHSKNIALGNNFNEWCNQVHMHMAISMT